MLQPATLSDLTTVASWIRSPRDCELWAGWRVQFPIHLDSLPAAIGFDGTNAFSFFLLSRLVAFGQVVTKSAQRKHLARLIVSPLHRRQGHGEALVRGLLSIARENECRRVSLY